MILPWILKSELALFYITHTRRWFNTVQEIDVVCKSIVIKIVFENNFSFIS